MKKVAEIIRIIFGLVFVVFGLNSYFHYIHVPPMTPAGQQFFTAILGTGYLFNFIKVVEVTCGVLLMLGLFTPLALVVITPIILNIFMFHFFLDPNGLPLAFILLGVLAFLLFAHRRTYSSLFVMKPK